MSSPFRIVLIDAVIEGGTRVQWDLEAGFSERGPYVFQLQFGRTGYDDADDWADVGSPVEDTFFAVDPTKRLFGKTNDAFYRVALTAPSGVYLSGPANVTQWLHHYHWRIARDIIRKEKLRHRLFASIDGYLLIRRRYGEICTVCTDPHTYEVIRASNCLSCFGTGIVGGYFDPMPGAYADVSLRSGREMTDLARGSVRDLVQQARFLGYPLLRSHDVWVNKHSDERYYIHRVADGGRVGNAPVVQICEMRLAPFTDIIYQFEI